MDPVERGRLLAQLLSGSWREPSAPIDPPAALDELSHLIVPSGVAGLVHRRIGAADDRFATVWKKQVLDEAIRARDLERIVTGLSAHGIAPVVIKGWALSSCYPARGLRPYHDLDLCIEPRELEAACARLMELGSVLVELPEGLARPPVLAGPENRDVSPATVDLHLGFPRLDDRDPVERARRMRQASLGAATIKLLGPEDHLRVLALHLFEHATWRPICLIDVAVLTEQLGPELDWGYLMAGDRHRSDAVRVALGLARELLDAKFAAPLALRVPAWAPRALLTAWGSGKPVDVHRPIARVAPTPRAIVEAARHRWKNPLIATYAVGGRFNDWPRWPYQLADLLLRAGRFARARLRAK